ncbi:hypothetical protein BCR37DRAFT_378536 [Protomyces lactucae-debilis]|uniref:ARID domain-containing protein n=1 Tax=Protomyces lactucae-debilis TaxID=2754530 RepID=A0A1Y2FKI2_PROLT|nr:uncharacterized protein BCR37DRAFT_378536 [Protomyces lactucae-debilis]ORY84501.1 hypothetical protein BCR37DRAFT_378536 [Protomyces lactucae-debilis]
MESNGPQQSVLGKRPRDDGEDAHLVWQSAHHLGTRPQEMGLSQSSSPVPRPQIGIQYPQQAVTGNAARKQNTPEFFMKSLYEFMRNRGTPIVQMPRIGDRPVNLVALYGHVMKAGGSHKINTNGTWPQIAATLHFRGSEDEVKRIYDANLATYEEAWTTARQKQHPKSQATESQVSAASEAFGNRGAQMAVDASQVSAAAPKQQVGQSSSAPSAARPSYVDHMVLPKQEVTETKGSIPERPEGLYIATDSSLDLEADVDLSKVVPFYASGQPAAMQGPKCRFRTAYQPKAVPMTTFASLELTLAANLGNDIDALRPYPSFQELGNVDIQAITRSLESALPAEVGNALDILAIIASDRRWGLPLGHCRDLLEALLECLSTSLESFSGVTQLSGPSGFLSDFQTYHDLLKYTQRISSQIRRSKERDAKYLHQHCAMERIMAVLTILRNLSFTEVNQDTMSSAADFAAILSGAISLLQHPFIDVERRLDLCKDAVTILANVGRGLSLPDAQVCRTYLHFLAFFGPDPINAAASSFESRQEPYLPSAIDALAKLLCRDAPNCQLIREELSSNLHSSTTPRDSLGYRLMCMALCPIPYNGTSPPLRALERHLPLVEHSLIVAEFMATYALAGGELAGILLNDFPDLVSGLWRLSHLSTGVITTKVQPADHPYALVGKKCAIVLRLMSEQVATGHQSRPFIRETQAVGTLLLSVDREMVENLVLTHAF